MDSHINTWDTVTIRMYLPDFVRDGHLFVKMITQTFKLCLISILDLQTILRSVDCCYARTDTENVQARRDAQLRQAESQMDAVDNSYLRNSDPRMPVLKPERSTRNSFGK